MPCFGIYPSGIITHINPVYICDITEFDLVVNIEKVLESGVQQLAEISAEEWKSQKKPLLEATGIKSWKELDKKSIGYGIEWVDQRVVLTFPALNKQYGVEKHTTKNISIDVDTPIEKIVKLIHDDYLLLKNLR